MALSTMLERLRARGNPAVATASLEGSPAPSAAPGANATTSAVDTLTAAVAALQQQCEALNHELRLSRESSERIAHREAQLRAIAHRDAEMDGFAEELDANLARRADIAGHVAAAIRRAPLQPHPFPHAIVDDVLPGFLYRSLLKGIPPVELFADKPANKQQLVVPFALAPVYSRKVWRFLALAVNPEDVTPAVMQKFDEPVTAWVRQHWPDEDTRGFEWHCTNGRVMRRERGYRIPPHRDPKWGFVTCLFYLARPEDSEAWGTQFYEVEGDAEASGVSPHWIDPAACRLVADIAFRPNRMLVFLNSVGAHGAHIPPDAEPADLDRYTFQFRIGPDAGTIARLQRTLPEERRTLWAGKVKDY